MLNRNLNEDLEKLTKAFFKNLEIDFIEFGGIGLDSKRPFGNSDACRDICDIIGLKCFDDNEKYYDKCMDYAYDLYHEKLIPYLKRKYLNEN